jgi:hypothetical protein
MQGKGSVLGAFRGICHRPFQLRSPTIYGRFVNFDVIFENRATQSSSQLSNGDEGARTLRLRWPT